MTESLERRVEALATQIEQMPPAKAAHLLYAFAEYVEVTERGGSYAKAEQASRRYLDLHPAALSAEQLAGNDPIAG